MAKTVKTQKVYPSLQQPQLSVRVPQELMDAVDLYCEQSNTSKRDFVLAAFNMLLASGKQLNVSDVSREEFETLSQTVQELAKKLAA